MPALFDTIPPASAPHSQAVSTSQAQSAPLAERIRPTKLQEIQGHQKHLAPNRPLRQMIESDSYASFILWGPPGCGKTTIIRLIAGRTKHTFHHFSAVFTKIADVKKMMQQAEQQRAVSRQQTIIFIDEIHRFSKSQQDAFLPYIESGAVILFGATTENPSFEVIPALLSRCHLFVLDALDTGQLTSLLRRAAEALGKRQHFSDDALRLLAELAGGDARCSLNDLELVSQNAEIGAKIEREDIGHLIKKRSPYYDKGGEEHYNLISALHKSIRGSDPQAALYWLARMITAGEEPLYIVRRLMRIASEDIGLADPNALLQAAAVYKAVHFLGMPEADTALTQLVVYLATAPKSNALEKAWLTAKADAEKSSHLKTPFHLRNAPTKVMAELGYGKGYKYSHDFANHYSYQKYFPDEMEEKSYYAPSSFGFEKDIAKRLAWWKGLRKREEEGE